MYLLFLTFIASFLVKCLKNNLINNKVEKLINPPPKKKTIKPNKTYWAGFFQKNPNFANFD